MKKMNKLLADLSIASQVIRNIHWNMKNENFYSLHKATDGIYNQLNDFVDDIAEKMLMRGGAPLSRYSDFLSTSSIKEIDPKPFSSKETIDTTLDILNTIEKSALDIEADYATQPLLDEIYMYVDKYRWIIESHKK